MPFISIKPVRSAHSAGVWALAARGIGLMFTLLGTGAMVWPAEPHIDRIEMLGTNRVTLHFDTAANTIYTLQYVDGLVGGANGMSSASWSNLTVLPATPFNNHYVLVDNRTNQHRFYRLSASPE